jgi:sugar lactone lactonase YvrE
MILYDVNKFFNKVLDKPTAYGFKDNMCGDAEGCIWDGGFHILSPMHEAIAKDMAKELQKFRWGG